MSDLARLAKVLSHLTSACLWETLGRPTRADVELVAATVAAVSVVGPKSREAALKTVRAITQILAQKEE